MYLGTQCQKAGSSIVEISFIVYKTQFVIYISPGSWVVALHCINMGRSSFKLINEKRRTHSGCVHTSRLIVIVSSIYGVHLSSNLFL